MNRRIGWIAVSGSGTLLFLWLIITIITPATAQTESAVLISAILYDGFAYGDGDEAVQIRNRSDAPVDVGGWSIGDGGSTRAILPAGVILNPGDSVWLARRTSDFRRYFGIAPDYAVDNDELHAGSLGGSWPGFANSGDTVTLFDAGQFVIDVVIYEGGDTRRGSWTGLAVEPYSVGSLFREEGQILYRRRDPSTGRLVADTNSAADWAQSDDPTYGRRVRYPGWSAEAFWKPFAVTATARLTVAVAPDNAFSAMAAEIDRADTSIRVAALTFEHVGLADRLVAAAQRGVWVTVLLEGGPAGGIPDQERYVCQQLEAAGGACWFMISDDSQRISARYRYFHGKYLLVDGGRAIVSSENMSPNSLPDDEKRDGTWGRRGVVLITDAVEVVDFLMKLFEEDLAPARHMDLYRWSETHGVYGLPPAGFVPITATGGTTYTVRYPDPLQVSGTLPLEIILSPDNALHPEAGLLGLLGRAGAGDTLLIQQLQERPFWGTSDSNPDDDPNLRLEAALNAARRGARVRLLLDSYFDDPQSPTANRATCSYVNGTAMSEGLDARCRLGNPAGLGIHNKMVLAHVGGRGYVHVGSWNGSEMSAKGNREVALQVQSDAAYQFLAEMFSGDWPHITYMPLVANVTWGPANHPLISEVLYNPAGPDDGEFIEIVNPTGSPVDLSGFSVADAVSPSDYEDLRRFPPGTVVPSQGTIVIAISAVALRENFGVDADFEILDSDPYIPELIDDPAWGDVSTFLQLGNAGDEILLRAPDDTLVDGIAYGEGSLGNLAPCPPAPQPGYALERHPYARDTDVCATDFRAWPFPSPGTLP